MPLKTPKVPLSRVGHPIGRILFLALFCGLTACTDPASLALGGASAVSFVQSGRTLTDHAMSFATDQDCSLRHSLAGKAWCQPVLSAAPDSQGEQSNIHCYRSIAAVTCYRHENPHDTASQHSGPKVTRTSTELAGNPPPVDN